MNQRKHELQKNELANFLTQELGEEGNWIPKVLVGLVAVAAIGVVVNYLFFQENTKLSAGWQNYYHALGDREAAVRLEELSEKEKDTIVGLWAKQSYADDKFGRALPSMIMEPDTFKKSVTEAEDAYAEVVKKAQDPLLKSRALLGLAKAQEIGGKFDEAIESYRKLAELAKGQPFGNLAQQSIDRLSNKDQVETLEWLAKEDLRPKTQIPGTVPQAPLPERPGLDVPGLPAPGLPAPGLTAPGATLPSDLGDDTFKLPGSTDEKKPEDKPAEDKPAEAPAEEKPAEPAAEAKPAEEAKPVEEAKPAPAEPAAEEKK
ncbi:MAG: tetratricopeptide repeat protein [Planctomycetaceae bacterium]